MLNNSLWIVKFMYGVSCASPETWSTSCYVATPILTDKGRGCIVQENSEAVEKIH